MCKWQLSKNVIIELEYAKAVGKAICGKTNLKFKNKLKNLKCLTNFQRTTTKINAKGYREKWNGTKLQSN